MKKREFGWEFDNVIGTKISEILKKIESKKEKGLMGGFSFA